MNPQVSVILPTFNRAAFLREALESLVQQSFKNFEVLVVDDGSTDNTPDIIKSYISKINLKTIVSEKNHGVSWARNQGIRDSKAPWLAFLDSDDLWKPKKLETQLAFLKKNPDCQICQTEEIWIRRGHRVNAMKKHAKSGGDIFKRCLELCVVSPSATIVSRKLLETTGLFDETLPACEDYDLWLRISYRYAIELIPQALVTKRGGHEDQLSRKYPAMDLFRIEAIQNLLDRHPLTEEQRDKALEALEEKCLIYAAGAKKRGRAQEAEVFEKRAARLRLKSWSEEPGARPCSEDKRYILQRD